MLVRLANAIPYALEGLDDGLQIEVRGTLSGKAGEQPAVRVAVQVVQHVVFAQVQESGEEEAAHGAAVVPALGLR